MPQQSVRTEVNACKTLERTEKNPLCHLNKFITFMLNRSRFGYIHHDELFHVKHAIRFNEQIDETEAYVTSIAFAPKRQLAEFISRTAHLTPSFEPHIVRLHTYSSVLTSTKCHCQVSLSSQRLSWPYLTGLPHRCTKAQTCDELQKQLHKCLHAKSKTRTSFRDSSRTKQRTLAQYTESVSPINSSLETKDVAIVFQRRSQQQRNNSIRTDQWCLLSVKTLQLFAEDRISLQTSPKRAKHWSSA